MEELQRKIDDFMKKFNDDEFESAIELAVELEALALDAWTLANEEVPHSIRIDH